MFSSNVLCRKYVCTASIFSSFLTSVFFLLISAFTCLAYLIENCRHNYNEKGTNKQRWEFIKENKKVRKQEKKERRKKTRIRPRKKSVLVFLFSYFLVFFFKFPPLIVCTLFIIIVFTISSLTFLLPSITFVLCISNETYLIHRGG